MKGNLKIENVLVKNGKMVADIAEYVELIMRSYIVHAIRPREKTAGATDQY